MELVDVLETLSITLCGVAGILWMSIGTLARSRAGEINGQRMIMGICIIASILLFVMHGMGGALWGSRNAARPMAVFSLVLAAASVLNLNFIGGRLHRMQFNSNDRNANLLFLDEIG